MSGGKKIVSDDHSLGRNMSCPENCRHPRRHTFKTERYLFEDTKTAGKKGEGKRGRKKRENTAIPNGIASWTLLSISVTNIS
jgi:hypothetical protein